ncbi:hypothetical protein I4I78_22155 [Pseudonocardia sp. KRD-291]|nr:hypothetical protein [Pseudonocardia sp. KRD291]
MITNNERLDATDDRIARPRLLPRPLLATLLLLSLAANAVLSLSPLPGAVGAIFGLISLAIGALLVRDHYRRRPRAGS